MKVMIDPSMPKHWKTANVAGLLAVRKAEAVGLLTSLWCEVMLQRETGILKDWTEFSIASYALWEGDPATFVKALISSKLLDRQQDQYAIHEWVEHQGDIVLKRDAWRKRQKDYRDRHQKNRKTRNVKTSTESTTPQPASMAVQKPTGTHGSRTPF